MLRKSLLYNAFDAQHMYKIVTLKANAQENHYFKMHLAPNMYKIITVEGKCS